MMSIITKRSWKIRFSFESYCLSYGLDPLSIKEEDSCYIHYYYLNDCIVDQLCKLKYHPKSVPFEEVSFLVYSSKYALHACTYCLVILYHPFANKLVSILINAKTKYIVLRYVHFLKAFLSQR